MELLRTEILHPLTDVVLYATIIDNSPAIRRVLIGSGARCDIAAAHVHRAAPELENAAWLMVSYLNGTDVDFSEIVSAPDNETPFASAVLAAARTIRFGKTCSYSELACRAGYPAAVRAAASVMRNNRLPLLVPCHRIVLKNGKPGAYNGDRAGDDAALKKKLLQMESFHLKQFDE